jgi:diguanylate cyclase
MIFSFSIPHSPMLVAFSVLLAALGGYVGVGLALKASESDGLRARLQLSGAAWALGLGIWTMHFVGILAAQFPSEVQFSIPLTLISFLICVLVVGIAAFWEGRVIAALPHTQIAALLMGAGIVSMHFLGMHAISGEFGMRHSALTTIAATVIAIATSYGALRLIERNLDHRALAWSALVFGLAVSGMHYTAMLGMTIEPKSPEHHAIGPLASSGVMTITVALLAFVISAAFLLSLIPESRRTEPAAVEQTEAANVLGNAKPAASLTIPTETDGAVRLLPSASICAIQATTHYTLVYDGNHEHFSPWSISEAETRLASQGFMRVHRSHLVAVDKVRALRRSGDGGLVEIGSPIPRLVPVSRSHYAELKARLGLQNKLKEHNSLQ